MTALARDGPAGFRHSGIRIFFLKWWLGLVATLFPGLVAWAGTAALAGLWLMVVPPIAILGFAALAAWWIADEDAASLRWDVVPEADASDALALQRPLPDEELRIVAKGEKEDRIPEFAP